MPRPSMSDEGRRRHRRGAGDRCGHRRALAADGLAVAVLDLDEGACKDTVDAIVGAGGKALGRRRRREPTPAAVAAAVDGGRRASSGRPWCWSTTPA